MCFARPRSGATYWHFTLSPRRVQDFDSDIAADIAEAYALAAAHIIQ
jgi:hypothetical protein